MKRRSACAIMREMPEMINLAERMGKQLPAELVSFLHTAGELAASQGQRLYLVGGVVRDLLLGKPNYDLDLVVEGNAIELARQLAGLKQGKITTHPRFNTAKVQWDKWSVDFATARSETYARPGALPTVKPSTIEKDLFRRDFTINAMALHLSPGRYSELIDRYGGKDDLEGKLIRILHEKSFIDDATRIWRALRYEQRFGFHIERRTLELLKRDIPMLDTISGDRIRYELECVFQEKAPEKGLRRAAELGILQKLHPKLTGNGWLSEKFESARRLSAPNLPSFSLYMALLTYHLTLEKIETLISYLRLPKPVAQTLRDTLEIKSRLKTLDFRLSNSTIYRLLHGYSQTAITANLLATDSEVARQHLETFNSKLRYIKPTLTGNDLLKMGIPQGRQIKEILARLLAARLDGRVTSKHEEVEMMRELQRL